MLRGAMLLSYFLICQSALGYPAPKPTGPPPADEELIIGFWQSETACLEFREGGIVHSFGKAGDGHSVTCSYRLNKRVIQIRYKDSDSFIDWNVIQRLDQNELVFKKGEWLYPMKRRWVR
jgi:hypothetical protein